jgi:hypothetical protein
VPGLPRLDLAAPERKGAGWGGRATVRHLRVFVSMYVYVCVRACACAHVYVPCVRYILSLLQSHACLCVHLTSRRQPLFQGRPDCCVLCAPGSPWNSRWQSCIERTRVASAAPLSSYRTACLCCRSRPMRPPSLASCVSWHPSQASRPVGQRSFAKNCMFATPPAPKPAVSPRPTDSVNRTRCEGGVS